MLAAAVVSMVALAAASGCSLSERTPGASSESAAAAPEHAVIVHTSLSNDDMGTKADLERAFALEDRQIAAIEAANAGALDGNEVGGGEVVFYAYGPDAQALYKAMAPELTNVRRPAFAILRFGSADDPKAIERRIDL
jgi:hypothetical protein